MIVATATAAAPERPRPTEYDRFRNHMGAAFANLEEAKWESHVGTYTTSEDVTDAIRTGRIAAYKAEKALDLGYQNSDDAGSYAGSVIEFARDGVEALEPFAGIRFSSGNLPAGLAEAMATAEAAFARAQEDVMESLHAMHD